MFFHDVSSLMSNFPKFNFQGKTLSCLSVNQGSLHMHRFPSLHDSFSSRFPHFYLKPYGVLSNIAPNILKWTSFSNKCMPPLTWHTAPKYGHLQLFNPNFKYVSTSAAYNLPPEEKLPSQPHSHTLRSSQGLSVMSCPHIHYITSRWWLGSRHHCDAIKQLGNTHQCGANNLKG